MPEHGRRGQPPPRAHAARPFHQRGDLFAEEQHREGREDVDAGGRHQHRPQAAAFGSLSPAAAMLMGVALLGETPDVLAVVAVLASGVGVALVNLGARRPQPGASQR